MDRVTSLLFLLAFVGCIDAYRMVLAPPNTCTKKRASVKISSTSGTCSRLRGVMRSSVSYDEIADCELDMCDVPASGRVASGWVYGVETNQYDPDVFTRTIVHIGTMRKYCDILRGNYDENLGPTRWLPCKLYLKRMDGSDRANIDSLIFAGRKQCTRVVDIKLMMTHRDCVYNDGTADGNPGGNDWIECYLRICISPVMKCAPSDMWTAVQVCRNPSSSTFECAFELTIGTEKGKTTESTYGVEASTTITSEVGVELEGIFTSKLSTSLTTGFNWASTKSSSQLWSETKTQRIEIEVLPGKSAGIYQVVGMCGDYKVDTMKYKTIDID